MTVTLGTKVRFAATAGVLALGLGCSTEPSKDNSPPGVPLVLIKPGDAKTEADPLPPQVPAATLENDPYYKARKIYLHGLDLLDLKKWSEASLEFDSALNTFPGYYRAWSKKGFCAYNLQQYNVEKFCYQQCLQIQEGQDYPEALLNLGNAYLYDDEIERAVPLYERLLEADPKHPVALFNLGICYFELRDYFKSIQYLSHFRDFHPEHQDHAKAERVLERAQVKWREVGSPVSPPNLVDRPR